MVGGSVYKLLKNNGYENLLTVSRSNLDLRNSNDVIKWFEINKPNVVIIAAAKVGGILSNKNNPVEFLLENLKIQNNLIETSWKFNIKRLLFLGSSCIYPKYTFQPIKEEYLLSGELEPSNDCYAIAKISGIKLCEALKKQYNFDSICLMPTNLYGPGDNYHPKNSHVIAALIRKFFYAVRESSSEVICWGSGSALREFMHADDLGDATVYVLENWDPSSDDAPKNSNGEPLTFLNVGTDQEVSIEELSNKISDIFNFKGEIKWDLRKPDGPKKKLLDSSKLKELGWHHKINLNEGLVRTINEYKKEILN